MRQGGFHSRWEAERATERERSEQEGESLEVLGVNRKPTDNEGHSRGGSWLRLSVRIPHLCRKV